MFPFLERAIKLAQMQDGMPRFHCKECGRELNFVGFEFDMRSATARRAAGEEKTPVMTSFVEPCFCNPKITVLV